MSGIGSSGPGTMALMPARSWGPVHSGGIGTAAAFADSPPSDRIHWSAVPWKVMTGTDRDGAHPGMSRMPDTGATAAIRSANTQAKVEDRKAPFEKPAA